MIDVIVVGAGAAGMMAAGTSAERGLKTVLFERNEKPGRKIMITGKGRCNVTNDCNEINELVKNVPVNGKFLFSAFSDFMPEDTIRFFEERNVRLKTERGKRVFPLSDKSSDIVDCLKNYVLKNKVEIKNQRIKKIIIENNKAIGVETIEGECFYANNIIIATGGKSYPQTGSTGDGYEMAKECGHTIVELKPSLVPLEVEEGWCSKAMGLSLRNVTLKVEDTKKKKIIFNEFGEMIFTHFGVSGPLVLSASSHIREMEKDRYILHIDLKSALTAEQLDKRLLREFTENSNKNFINVLDSLLPKKIVPIIANLSKIEFSRKANQITKIQREDLIKLLKDVKLTLKKFRPIDEAIITSGGISVKEINPRTMESKIINKLYFCGEILDVDAYTGGFNLQIAFSSGRTAGNSVN